MITYANTRVHGTTRKIPVTVFTEQEKHTLQPLPENPFAFFNRSIRRVALNCHIHFENNYYSVPHHLVRKDVTVRWNDHLVRIISEGEQVALHQKPTGVGNYVTDKSHMPPYKVYSATEYQGRFEEKMAAIGEAAHTYFHMLLETKESYWFRSVRAILGLREHYGNEAVNATLQRALYYQVTELGTIKNILEKKLYLLEIEPTLLQVKAAQNSMISEQSALFRDLTYYQAA